MKNLKVALAVTAALIAASGANAFENEKAGAEKSFFSGLVGKTVMEAGESAVPMVEIAPGINEEFDGEAAYLTEYDRIEARFEEGTVPGPEDITGSRPAVLFSSDSPFKKMEVTVHGIDVNKFTNGAEISLMPRPAPQEVFTAEEFRSVDAWKNTQRIPGSQVRIGSNTQMDGFNWNRAGSDVRLLSGPGPGKRLRRRITRILQWFDHPEQSRRIDESGNSKL